MLMVITLNKASRHLLLIWALLASALLIPPTTPVTAQTVPCQYNIDETLANGANWTMCWSESPIDGVTLWSISFRPPGGTTRLVLYEARLAQIFVPYDDNGARFHDVTDYGLGNYRVNLTAGECPGGTLLQNNGINVICKTKAINQGYAFRNGANVKLASTLTLLSASKIGAYTYLQKWTFDDDGTIEPSIGATGQLQRCISNSSYGWALTPSSNCPSTSPYGASHVHNYYWYLDFDLGGTTNDQASTIEISGDETSYTRTMSKIGHPSETGERYAQHTGRFWRVRDTTLTNADGHPISYELLGGGAQAFYAPEAFTQNDIYFTQRNTCERYASHNISRTGCGSDDVFGYLTGQTISDLVVWYRISFHHVPHDEDDYNMSTHWNGFQIIPRDMTATNPR
jgi:primary-amine oxidase